MRPVIKNRVAIFYPTGFLDGDNASSIITSIDEQEIISKRPEGVFISLKKIIFFNIKGISYLAKRLLFLKDKCMAFVGFCDYSVKMYNSILSVFDYNITFSLIEKEETLFLFCGNKKVEDKSIIIYSDDHSQKNQIAMALLERKLKVKIAKNEEELKQNSENFDFVISHSYIGNIEKAVTVFVKNSIIIYTLKGFIDSDIYNTFDMKYHKNSIRVGFRIFCFDVSEVSSANIHGANFLSKLSIDGAEFGVTIVVCGLNSNKTTTVIIQDLEDAGILMYDDLKSFFEDEDVVKQTNIEAQKMVKKTKINKKIISVLPDVMESTVQTIEVLSNKKISKKNVEIAPLESNMKDEVVISAIGFYGDVDAIFFLVMNKDDAQDVCKVLLAEEFSSEELSDAFSEFANVIGGKILQKLKSKNINAETTMPRIFDKMSEVKKLESTKHGVQINFQIEDREMILFLTN